MHSDSNSNVISWAFADIRDMRCNWWLLRNWSTWKLRASFVVVVSLIQCKMEMLSRVACLHWMDGSVGCHETFQFPCTPVASHQPDRNTNRIASFNTKSPVLSANLPGIIMVYLCLLTAIFDSPVFFSFYLPRWATCNYERKWTVISHTYHIDKKPRIALVCRF